MTGREWVRWHDRKCESCEELFAVRVRDEHHKWRCDKCIKNPPKEAVNPYGAKGRTGLKNILGRRATGR